MTVVRTPLLLSSPVARRPRRAAAIALAAASCAASALAVSPSVPDGSGEQVLPFAKKDQGPVVTYTGFRVHDDGSASLRVEVTESVPVTKKQEGTVVTYTLKGARITIRNNRNPLLAKHFASNVLSATLVPEKDAVSLVVKLRKEAALTHRMVEQAGGAATLYVDVPKAPK